MSGGNRNTYHVAVVRSVGGGGGRRQRVRPSLGGKNYGWAATAYSAAGAVGLRYGHLIRLFRLFICTTRKGRSDYSNSIHLTLLSLEKKFDWRASSELISDLVSLRW